MDGKELIERLRIDAEWAEGQEWETPICLQDDLREAIAVIEKLDQVEKDGRLVVLPCKVGDTVWVVFGDSARKAVYKTRVQGISITTRSTAILNFGGYPVQYAWASEVGKTVFLTREEAEVGSRQTIAQTVVQR